MFNLEIIKEDEDYMSFLKEIPDVFGYAITKEDSIIDLTEQLWIYALDYMGDLNRYANEPNRAGHLGIIKQIINYADEKVFEKELLQLARLSNSTE